MSLSKDLDVTYLTLLRAAVDSLLKIKLRPSLLKSFILPYESCFPFPLSPATAGQSP